ncbi:MAG: flagellar protein FlgN [Candidatus Gastranaerophilales bacterium]|nr:flagellar protein FlgN [Candidatus Gastranaerophilales bacterium]
MENYLNVLEESLHKKIHVLGKIQEYNARQQQIFQSDMVDMDEFDQSVEEKGKLIEEVEQLDNGFELLYANLARQLQEDKTRYAAQIHTLQELIKQITDMGVTVQAQEARNKRLIEEYFRKSRQNLNQDKKTSKAAFDYYKNMNNSHFVPPQFMDSKQ